MAVIAAFVINAALNFALGLLIAQFLGPADFGRFALGTAGAVLLNTLLFEWLRLSATRFYSDRVRRDEPWIRAMLNRAYAAVAVGLAGAALLVLAGGELAARWHDETRLAAAAAAAAVGIGLFDAAAALTRARFEGGLYFRLVLAKNALALALMTATAWLLPFPPLVMVAGGLSQFLAVLAVRRALADPPHAPDRARRHATLRVFAAYGLPLIAANAVYHLMPFANRAAVAALAGFSESGYFSLAADIGGRIFSTLGAALDLLLFQLAVQAEEHHGAAAGEAQVARNGAVVVALLLPCAAGFWLVAPAVEAIVVPEAFRGHFAHYTLLLLPGLFAGALMNFALNPIFQIRRRTRPVIVAALIGAGVNGLGGLALARAFGASGIAAAQSLGLMAACLFLALRGLTGPRRLRLPLRDLAASLAATGLMVAAVLPLRGLGPWPALGASVAAGAAVYGAAVWIFDIAGLRAAVAPRLRRAVPAA
ncbi:membrane protein involved in the export of O-antigen and teichoic acid-like protein [Methylobacterium sp. 4-46]|uniref:lipopolysaccharide biosynthesis protein n=1 Tax=unclassified Methylobacterium TaxID=2615210 RepID=UPI000165C827|nr:MULTISPECIES: polysaccharide biosynthesis C-terminal domain-containing protein [Methylobacterium]ACA16256.1 membrane protein involved in the export of O-antigen and teichoic acid-like protein [Methylobacterium sp. 4-46]WFT81964.1 polysaccharide biosynthesis C-terminal domain-containing protein [Methylobacterium nodulans]